MISKLQETKKKKNYTSLNLNWSLLPKTKQNPKAQESTFIATCHQMCLASRQLHAKSRAKPNTSHTQPHVQQQQLRNQTLPARVQASTCFSPATTAARLSSHHVSSCPSMIDLRLHYSVVCSTKFNCMKLCSASSQSTFIAKVLKTKMARVMGKMLGESQLVYARVNRSWMRL